MEKLYQNIYSYLAYPALIAGARLASPFHRKLREGFRIHKNALARWKEKAGTLDPQNPRLWFHATSTGEFEAARPVIDLVRERLGENVSIIFSYYSPSVHKAATSYAAADICEILPLDTKRCVRRVLDWVRPTAIIFVRYDTWPNLIWEASSRGVKLALIAALLRKGSFRIASGFGRALSRVLYSRFDYVGAAAQPDMERLRGICGPRTQVKMTGDSRLDRVKSRKERSQELRIPRSLRPQGDHILVCGSTWPNDEEFIVPAIRRAIAQGLRFRTIIAPHEPTRRHVESLENRLSAAGLASVRYSDVVSGDAPREIKIRHIGNCLKADPAYGKGVADALGIPISEVPQ